MGIFGKEETFRSVRPLSKRLSPLIIVISEGFTGFSGDYSDFLETSTNNFLNDYYYMKNYRYFSTLSILFYFKILISYNACDVGNLYNIFLYGNFPTEYKIKTKLKKYIFCGILCGKMTKVHNSF